MEQRPRGAWPRQNPGMHSNGASCVASQGAQSMLRLPKDLELAGLVACACRRPTSLWWSTLEKIPRPRPPPCFFPSSVASPRPTRYKYLMGGGVGWGSAREKRGTGRRGVVFTETRLGPSESGTGGRTVEEGSSCRHLGQGRASSAQGRQLAPHPGLGFRNLEHPFHPVSPLHLQCSVRFCPKTRTVPQRPGEEAGVGSFCHGWLSLL